MKKAWFLAVLLSLAGAAFAQTITVTSPNGGENWPQGSSKPITWTSSGVTGNVTIVLFKGGNRVGVIQDNVPVAQGTINWIVGKYQGGTAVPGTDYKIRVRKMQSDILDASNRDFTIGPPETVHAPPNPPAPPTSPSSIAVTSPNGGETWLLKPLGPNTAPVTWSVSHLGGTFNVILKKGGAPVRSMTAPSSGPCVFSYAGLAEGDDYRIRVESSDRIFADESDRDFALRRQMMTPAVPRPVNLALAVTEFKLDNGAERTENPIVTMNHAVLGTPTHYRWKNEGMPDWSPWVPYSGPAPRANIPEACGGHTIRFQVKNGDGESGVVEDAINYSFYRDITVSASEAKDYCGSEWVFRITRRDFQPVEFDFAEHRLY